MVLFTEHDHKYTGTDGTLYTSVTTLLKSITEPFDAKATAQKCSTRKPGRYPNKWYELPVDEILAAWDAERDRAAELGTWYHLQRELGLYNLPNVVKPVIDPNTGIKSALPQKLQPDKVYPEFLCYLLSAKVAGQIDRLVTSGYTINLGDYKTSKEIRREGFKNWEGITKKMLSPVEHLDDCEYNKYALQMSFYMYILLRHNPNFVPGTMTIEHVSFEIDTTDKWGYPIYKKDENGDPIVKNVELIEVPYLKSEVIAILKSR